MEHVFIDGVVGEGRQLGRRLGFPTANISVDVALAVSDGVYRSRTTVDGVSYYSMSNLGCNPSVGGVERRLETHLFGFSGSLYGRRIVVELLEKIRDERHFSSLEELEQQIRKDREQILAMCGR